MKQKKHEIVLIKLEQMKYEIERLEELLSLTSEPLIKNRIQLRLYELAKEIYILEQIINF